VSASASCSEHPFLNPAMVDVILVLLVLACFAYLLSAVMRPEKY
jgi:hypothetical protein